MNTPVSQVMEKRIAKTIAALQKNNMGAAYIATHEELIAKIKELIPSGAHVAWGGSATLKETGVVDFLQTGGYVCHNRNLPGLTPEENKAISRKAFDCDIFLTGTNAVTEDGQLYNVDGNGNRVAPMIYGPDRVIVVVGQNKIVADLEQAKLRVQKLCAPANGIRLETGTPCAQTGECIGGNGCFASRRMCCTYTTFGFQREKERIYVLILPENLGF